MRQGEKSNEKEFKDVRYVLDVNAKIYRQKKKGWVKSVLVIKKYRLKTTLIQLNILAYLSQAPLFLNLDTSII